MCSSTNTAHYRGAPGCIFWLDLTGGSRMKVSKECDLFCEDDGEWYSIST